MFKNFNPKLKDFMEKYPNQTMLGFYWSQYWRVAVLILAVEVILFGLILLLFLFAR